VIRKLALALALWLAPLPALAALAIDSQESANTGHAGASPLTWSFTNTAGTLLIVGVCLNNTAAGTPAVSAVTYNGVAMSAISGTTNTGVSGSSTTVCTLYQLLSPATGAHTVSVTWAGNCGGCYADAIAGAISFTGNNSTTPTGNPGTASDTSGASSAATVSLTGTASGDYVVSLVATGSAVGGGSGSTTTSWKLNVTTNDAGDNAALGQQTTAGGTVSAGFSVTPDLWFMSAIEVFAGGGAAPPTPTNGLELVSVGGTLNHGDGSPGGGGGALAPGFFVSSTGNDNNLGTLASPWATIFHAQQVMRGNNCGTVPTGICLTYVRSGTYNLTSAISATSADNGETLQFYPPDGVNTAILDGGNTIDGIFQLNGVTNFTINGLKIQNPVALAVFCGNACNGLTLKNSDISLNHSGNSALGFGGFAPILGLFGRNMLISHNAVHDAAGTGIGVYAFASGDSIDGTVIDGNAVYRIGQSVNDDGAIYCDMHANNLNGGHITISNNYVVDYGASGVQSEGIYLDDDCSNATVTGNIIGPPNVNMNTFGNFRADILINGGCCNTFQNNLVDLGATAADAGNWIYGMSNNSGSGGSIPFTWTSSNIFQNNIVISGYSSNSLTTRDGVVYDQAGGTPTQFVSIQKNAYHNYGGGIEATNGTLVSDISPQHYTPTQLGLLSCPNGVYAVSGGSTVTGAPVSFPLLPTSWGPPGFTPPATPNHSC
jgi:hypothetical protein